MSVDLFSKVIATSGNLSFELAAIESLGDAASIFLVTVMVECIRLPAAIPVAIGVLRTTFTSGMFSDIAPLLMGPCLKPFTVMYASTAAMAWTAGNSAETALQSTN